MRDLALGRDLVDVDVAAEGEVESLAATAASALGGRWVAHGEFGTVTLEANGARVDLAMARAETYARPGALPRVRPASIREDLARRDFTINALALAMCGPERGRLLDPFGGWEDLRRGLVRVLHQRSFIDDATRILRAVRYAARLGFRLETADAVRAATGRFLSGYHQRGAAAAGAAAAPGRGAAGDGPPGLPASGRAGGAAPRPALRCPAGQRLPSGPPPERCSWAPSSICLCLALPSPRMRRVPSPVVWRFRRESGVRWRARPLWAASSSELAQTRLRPSQVVALLEAYPEASLWAWSLVASSPTVRRRLRRHLEYWRYVKSSLDGRALQRLGVPRGPLVGEAMRMLRAARLDGQVRSREGEVAAVRRLLAARGGSS